jgi:hypothetical protein
VLRDARLRWHPAQALALALMIAPVAVFVAMTLGKGWSYWPYYPWILSALGLLAAGGIGWFWIRYRTQRAEFVARADPALSPWGALQQFSPGIVVLGFIAGSIPTIFHMATLTTEFWVHPTALDLPSLIDRLRSTLWIEVGPMLDLLRLDSFDNLTGAYENPATLRTYFYLLLYGLGAYALFARFRRPASRDERIGVVFVIGFALIVMLFRAALPRNPNSLSPRFVMPMIIPAAIVLGLAFRELVVSLTASTRRPWATRAASIGLGAVCIAMFALSWRDAPPVPIERASGHRTYALEIVEALRNNNVRRVYIEYRPGADQEGWIPLGWELMHASHNEIRFHWATFDDRLYGLLDEDAYGWDEWYMYRTDERSRPETVPSGDLIELAPGFEVANYRVIRLPEGYTPHRGWLPWSPRGTPRP